MNKILDTVSNTIKKYNLVQENDIIVVAVSGGPDSMCLLNNLLCLKDEFKVKEIVVAHVNHMLREEAKAETEYVKEYCKSRNIRCFVKFVDITKIAKERKTGTEETGRIERYKFFDEVSNEVCANKIAIAHNLKDNAETVLMHLLRGSGVSGLSGIKPYREGKYIRPLIKCEREEIEDYCKERNLNPKFDKTNNENTYTRNKIRNELIPYIQKEFNPNIIETLDRLSELITEEEKYVQNQTKKAYNETVINETIESVINKEKEKGSKDNTEMEDQIQKNEKTKIIIDLKKFNNLENAIKSRLILYIVKKLFGSTNGIEKKHVEDIIKLCGNNIGNKYTMPNKFLKVLVQNKKIYFVKIGNL